MEKRNSLLVDLMMAHRFLYYVRNRPILRDASYDALEAEARKVAPPDHPLHKPGSDLEESYPHSIRALALYMELEGAERVKADAGAILDFDIPEDIPGIIQPVKTKPGSKIVPDDSIF